MPNPSVNVYDAYTVAGTEVSSTYEGRHIQIEESVLCHPVHAGDTFVNKGDPVSVMGSDIVGVAFASADAVTDYIAIDTEGIWALSVVGKNDEGGEAVAIGDVIYINRTNGELSKITSDTTHAVFGYALNEVVSGQTTVIAVKVHWDQWFDIYRDYLAGGAVEDALLIDVDDATTIATGYGQGLYVCYRNTGDKTGDAEVHPISADLFLTGDVTYGYVYTAYIATSGNPALGQLAAFSAYIDDPGTACTAITAIDIGLAGGANSPSGRHCFMRMRNHSAGSIPDCAFQFEGTGNADYFASWETVSVPIIAAAIGGNQTHKIAVRVANVNYFIPLHTA